MNNLLIIDSTLRDGSHAVRHQLTANDISNYSKGAEAAGTQLLVVGHGNGLGASSLQLGMSLLPDEEMLSLAKKELKKTKLGAFLIPGFGTIKNDIEPAIEIGIDALLVACHCTEANITKQHIEYVIEKGIKAYGVLMMSHMISAKELLGQALLMQDYGASGVILMDSAGASLPQNVREKVRMLCKHLNIDVGFHAHNNLSLAVANSMAAIEAGATILDATSKGLGAGAGNCQLEVLVAVLEKMGIKTALDLNQVIANGENIISKIKRQTAEISADSLISGLSGIFSGFAPHAKKAAKRFNVDTKEILIELGKRKVVAGQEDIIIDVAVQLLAKKNKKTNAYEK